MVTGCHRHSSVYARLLTHNLILSGKGLLSILGSVPAIYKLPRYILCVVAVPGRSYLGMDPHPALGVVRPRVNIGGFDVGKTDIGRTDVGRTEVGRTNAAIGPPITGVPSPISGPGGAKRKHGVDGPPCIRSGGPVRSVVFGLRSRPTPPIHLHPRGVRGLRRPNSD